MVPSESEYPKPFKVICHAVMLSPSTKSIQIFIFHLPSLPTSPPLVICFFYPQTQPFHPNSMNFPNSSHSFNSNSSFAKYYNTSIGTPVSGSYHAPEIFIGNMDNICDFLEQYDNCIHYLEPRCCLVYIVLNHVIFMVC